ncbi:MAG: sulfite exporter TauE/SafE family protein [Ramlibacter sp.]|nr:sulfite exporter TauE/SafE family protein [Ramlibacter sp.]
MGLAGGPHCAAMCGTACAGLMRAGVKPTRSLWIFQAGRLVGYSLAGAAAAAAVQSFAWLASSSAALKPLWTFFHLAVLAWGLMLVTRAHQPMWVTATGRNVWSRVRPLAASGRGVFAAGALWAFMPCGLLYSALLVASLSGGAVEGAVSMALFAAGSAVSLSLAPLLLLRFQGAANRWRAEWGTRLAGLMLAAAAVWALWMDTAHTIAVWCGLA